MKNILTTVLFTVVSNCYYLNFQKDYFQRLSLNGDTHISLGLSCMVVSSYLSNATSVIYSPKTDDRELTLMRIISEY